MTNIYWPVYQNLETEVEGLTFAIHVDDGQLGVYSPKISDLILRAAADIESISKELYKANGGTKTDNIKFDYDAIEFLNEIWSLEKKIIVISSASCFQTNRTLLPFQKTEARTKSKNGRLTYSWNNAYQNLKHDRGNSLSFGSLKYLFDIMAALFLLNIYYKDTVYPLEKDQAGLTFSAAQGSKVFSIKLKTYTGHDGQGRYIKCDGFEEHAYFINHTEDTGRVFQEVNAEYSAGINELFQTHPKMLEYKLTNDLSKYEGDNLAWDVLGKDEYIKLIQQASMTDALIKAGKQLKYEAILNKNQMPY